MVEASLAEVPAGEVEEAGRNTGFFIMWAKAIERGYKNKNKVIINYFNKKRYFKIKNFQYYLCLW